MEKFTGQEKHLKALCDGLVHKSKNDRYLDTTTPTPSHSPQRPIPVKIKANMSLASNLSSRTIIQSSRNRSHIQLTEVPVVANKKKSQFVANQFNMADIESLACPQNTFKPYQSMNNGPGHWQKLDPALRNVMLNYNDKLSRNPSSGSGSGGEESRITP